MIRLRRTSEETMIMMLDVKKRIPKAAIATLILSLENIDFTVYSCKESFEFGNDQPS